MAASASINENQPDSICDDFEVIEEAQPPSVVSINPYEMSLEVQPHSVDLQQLYRQINMVSQQLGSLVRDFADNNESLHNQVEKQKQLSKDKDVSVTSDGAQFEQMKTELCRLQICQEEWQQTKTDYAHLKSQYGLMATTKEQLEAEKAELVAKLEQTAKYTATASIEASMKQIGDQNDSENDKEKAFQEQLRQALQSRQSIQQTEMETLQQTIIELEEQLLEKQSKLDKQKSKTEQVTFELNQAQELSLSNEISVKKMELQIAQLQTELQEEKEKLCDVEHQHLSELEFLRQNSDVRRLEELRRDLERRQEREVELSRLYGESDQTVDQIIRAAEEDRQLMQSEIGSLKRQIESMESALTENGKRLTAATGREMEAQEKLGSVNEQLRRLSEEVRLERDQLRNSISRLELELESERRSGCMKDAKLSDLESRLQAASSHAAQLKDQLARQGSESDATVGEVLAGAEADRRALEGRIGELERQLTEASSRRAASEQELLRKAASLAESLNTVANLQRHCDNLQAGRAIMERQMQESKQKQDEAIKVASQLRDRLQVESVRAATLESELASLKVEHASVRAGHLQMEHRLTDLLAKEQQSTAQAAQAEETMQVYRAAMEQNRLEFQRECSEKQTLKRERDSLAEQIQRMHSGVGQ